MKTKSKPLAVLLLMGVICMTLSGTGCKRHAAPEPQAVRLVAPDILELSSETLKNVTFATAHTGQVADRISVMGRIAAPEDRITSVSARVAGRINAVYVASGEDVKEGQLLADIFSPDFSASREEYLQALKHPAAESGDIDLASMARRKLINLGVSPGDLERLKDAPVDQTSYLQLRAPKSGALLTKNAVVGNAVNVGDTLFTIGNLKKVWFVGDIYPEDLQRVHKDQEVVIEPYKGAKPVLGTVSFISPVIDPTTRTVKIRALMDNPDLQLRQDMYVRGGLTLSRRSAFVIPPQALIHLGDRFFCFKSLGGNRFQKVPVDVGGQEETWVEVKSGLKEGDQVIVEGALLLEGALTSNENS